MSAVATRPSIAPRKPRRINDVIDYAKDGKPITVIERACETLSFAGTLDDAAARCGTTTALLRRWVEVGQGAIADVLGGRRRHRDLSRDERECAEFAAHTASAEAEGRMRLVARAQQRANGGETFTTIRERVTGEGANAKVIERTTTTEVAEPSDSMIQFLLSRRWPKTWGGAQRLELTGADGGPVEIETNSPADRLLADLAGMAVRMAEHGAGPSGDSDAIDVELAAILEPPSPDESTED